MVKKNGFAGSDIFLRSGRHDLILRPTYNVLGIIIIQYYSRNGLVLSVFVE